MSRLLSTLPRITLLVLLSLPVGLSPTFASAAPASASPTPVTGPPSISAGKVAAIVRGTPLAPLATTIYQTGQQRQIDPAFALAVWTVESNLDRAGAAVRNNNPGNLTCAAAAHPPATGCSGRWAVYPTLAAAVTDWYRYIAVRYIQRGLTTVEAIIRVYAPPSENNTSNYIATVKRLMAQWRSQDTGAPAPAPSSPPSPPQRAPQGRPAPLNVPPIVRQLLPTLFK